MSILVNKSMCINVSFDFAAIHCWPGAEGKHEYLKYPHRHIFKCQASVEVFHDDRDIEFFALKDQLNTLCTKSWRDKNIGAMSCEMIAEEIYKYISKEYPKRDVIISVSEDGENGVTVNYLL